MKNLKMLFVTASAIGFAAAFGITAYADGESQLTLEGITVIDLDEKRADYDYDWTHDMWEIVFCPEENERTDDGWGNNVWLGSMMNSSAHSVGNPVYYTYGLPGVPKQISSNPYDQLEIKFSMISPSYPEDEGEYVVTIGNAEHPLSDLNVYCLAKELDLYVQRCYYKDSIADIVTDDFCHENITMFVDLAEELAAQGIVEAKTPYGDFSAQNTDDKNYTVKMPLSAMRVSSDAAIKVTSDPTKVTVSEHSALDFSESEYIQSIAALQGTAVEKENKGEDRIIVDAKSKIAVKAGETISIAPFIQLFSNGEMCDWETKSACSAESDSAILLNNLGDYKDLYKSYDVDIISFSLENEKYAKITSGVAESAKIEFDSDAEGQKVKLYVTLTVGRALRREIRMEYTFQVYGAGDKVKFTLDGEELPKRLYDDCDFAVYSPFTEIIEYIPYSTIGSVPYSAEIGGGSTAMQVINDDSRMHTSITFVNGTASSEPVKMSFGGESYTVRVIANSFEDFIVSSSVPMNELFNIPCVIRLNKSKYLGQYLSDIGEIKAPALKPHTVEFPVDQRVAFIQNKDNALKKENRTSTKGIKECEKSATTVQVGDAIFDIPVTVWDGEDKIYVLPKKVANSLTELYTSMTSEDLEKYAVDLSEEQIVNMSDMVIDGEVFYTTYDFYVLRYPDILAECTPVLKWGKENGTLSYSQSKGYYTFEPSMLKDTSTEKKAIITLKGEDVEQKNLIIRIETGILHFSPSLYSYRYPLSVSVPSDLNDLSDNISIEEKLHRLTNAVEVEQGGAMVKTQKIQLYIDDQPYKDPVYYVLKSKSHENNLSSNDWKLYKKSDSGVYGNIYEATGPISVNIKGKTAEIELMAFLTPPEYGDLPSAKEGASMATVKFSVKGDSAVSDFVEITEGNEDLYGTYSALSGSNCTHKPLSGMTLVGSGDSQFYYSYELIADQETVVLEAFNNDSTHVLVRKKESLVLPYAISDIKNGRIYADGLNGGMSVAGDDVVCVMLYNPDGSLIRELCGDCPTVITKNGIDLGNGKVIPMKDENGAYNFFAGAMIKTTKSPCVAVQNVVLSVTPSASGGNVLFTDVHGQKYALRDVYKVVTTGKNGNAVTVSSAVVAGGKIYLVGLNSDTGVQERVEYTGQKVYAVALKETTVNPPNADTPTVLTSDSGVASVTMGNYDRYRTLYERNNAEFGVVIEGEDEGEATVDIYGMYGSHCAIRVSVHDGKKKSDVNYASYTYTDKFIFEMETPKKNYTVKAGATLLIPLKVSTAGEHPFSKTIEDPYDEIMLSPNGLNAVIEGDTIVVKENEKGKYTIHLIGYTQCNLSVNIVVR